MQKLSLKTVAGSSLLGALAIAAVAVASAQAAPVAQPTGSEKCYGIAKAAKNDCQTATHSCAGTASKDGQADSWIYVPAGTCSKLTDGSNAAKA